MRAMARVDPNRFADLTFEEFRQLATDPALSAYEKIGFPNEYREGYEPAIYADIAAKLPPLASSAASRSCSTSARAAANCPR